MLILLVPSLPWGAKNFADGRLRGIEPTAIADVVPAGGVVTFRLNSKIDKKVASREEILL